MLNPDPPERLDLTKPVLSQALFSLSRVLQEAAETTRRLMGEPQSLESGASKGEGPSPSL